jgi:hypothetical protein
MSDPRDTLGKDMLFHRFHNPYYDYRSSSFQTITGTSSVEVSREAAL